jgi:outer membrane protein assembly factor BamB
VFCYDDGTVICLRKDGTVAWQYKTHGSIVATPALFQEEVFICSADSHVYSVSMRTGLLLWSKKLSAAIYSSPAVNERVVVTGCADGKVWCLNRQDGKPNWICGTGGVIAGAPAISGSLVYAGNLSGYLYIISIANGEIIDTKICNGRLKTSPLVYRQFLLLIVESRSLVGFRGSYQ